MRSLGKPLDPWQELAVHHMLGERDDGLWASRRVGILVARQNGKGAILEARELAGAVLFGEKLILHSAHEFKTAAEAFLRVKELVDANDWLAKRLLRGAKGIRTSHGEEAFLFQNGARLRFVARSRSSGRGFSGDVNILDEAQELPEAAISAMMPTMSARPNPQMIFTGTVPEPENDSAVWTRLMRQGRKGGGSRIGWIEWSPAESVTDLAGGLDDREAWALANPALGMRITEDFIEDERASMSELGFARERLSLWETEDSIQTVIPMKVWDGLTDPESHSIGKVALAVDLPPNRSAAVICAMGYRDDGNWHGEVIEEHSGTEWVAITLGEMLRRSADKILGVIVDPASPAGSLIPDIEAEGVTVTPVTTREHAAACGALYDRATRPEPGIFHTGDPILHDALKAATKRPGPEGTWLWNRKETSGPNSYISPIVALTLAGYGLQTLTDPEVDVWGFWS